MTDRTYEDGLREGYEAARKQAQELAKKESEMQADLCKGRPFDEMTRINVAACGMANIISGAIATMTPEKADD